MAETLQVEVPTGIVAGQSFNVTTPDGQVLTLTCPEGSQAGSPIQFSYIPKTEVKQHPDDEQLLEQAMKLAEEQQAALIAAGAVAAAPPAAGPFSGNVFPAAQFAVGSNAIVTRSSGEESGCNIVEVFLTAMGPQYNVYLGQDAAGQNIMKWCGENDLRAYPQ